MKPLILILALTVGVKICPPPVMGWPWFHIVKPPCDLQDNPGESPLFRNVKE